MIQCDKCKVWLKPEEMQDHLNHTGRFAPRTFKWSKGKLIKQGCEGNTNLYDKLIKINSGR